VTSINTHVSFSLSWMIISGFLLGIIMLVCTCGLFLFFVHLFIHSFIHSFVHSFIHPFATCRALGQDKQNLKYKRHAPSPKIYKTYINSVSKPISIIDQLHKYECYLNRLIQFHNGNFYNRI
jgi:hypothetical protein